MRFGEHSGAGGRIEVLGQQVSDRIGRSTRSGRRVAAVLVGGFQGRVPTSATPRRLRRSRRRLACRRDRGGMVAARFWSRDATRAWRRAVGPADLRRKRRLAETRATTSIRQGLHQRGGAGGNAGQWLPDPTDTRYAGAAGTSHFAGGPAAFQPSASPSMLTDGELTCAEQRHEHLPSDPEPPAALSPLPVAAGVNIQYNGAARLHAAGARDTLTALRRSWRARRPASSISMPVGLRCSRRRREGMGSIVASSNHRHQRRTVRTSQTIRSTAGCRTFIAPRPSISCQRSRSQARPSTPAPVRCRFARSARAERPVCWTRDHHDQWSCHCSARAVRARLASVVRALVPWRLRGAASRRERRCGAQQCRCSTRGP
jgi:hypothetical protein